MLTVYIHPTLIYWSDPDPIYGLEPGWFHSEDIAPAAMLAELVNSRFVPDDLHFGIVAEPGDLLHIEGEWASNQSTWQYDCRAHAVSRGYWVADGAIGIYVVIHPGLGHSGMAFPPIFAIVTGLYDFTQGLETWERIWGNITRHEFGHVLGLLHCPTPDCVMQYPGPSVVAYFCDGCLRKLSRNWPEYTPPFPSFALTPAMGQAPLQVQFLDNSEWGEWKGGTIERLWGFGDGNSSTEENPINIYGADGEYLPQLTATNPIGPRTRQIGAVAVVPGAVLVADSSYGAIVIDPGEGTFQFNLGDNIRLRARVSPGYYWRGWEGDIEDIDNPSAIDTRITLNAPYQVKAVAVPEGIGTIIGSVTDIAGQSIVGATVTAISEIDTFVEVTDVLGDYAFGDIPTGAYVIAAEATGYESQTQSARVTEGASVTVPFALEEGAMAAYVLVVLDPTEGGVVTSPVSGYYEEGTVLDCIAVPNPGWQFVAWTSTPSNVVDDPYSAVTTITINGAYQIKAVFELIPVVGGVGGFVTDVDGAPIMGALVTLDSLSDVTDEGGYYELLGVPVGSYTLTASLGGHRTASEAIVVEQDLVASVDFTLEFIPGFGVNLGSMLALSGVIAVSVVGLIWVRHEAERKRR